MQLKFFLARCLDFLGHRSIFKDNFLRFFFIRHYVPGFSYYVFPSVQTDITRRIEYSNILYIFARWGFLSKHFHRLFSIRVIPRWFLNPIYACLIYIIPKQISSCFSIRNTCWLFFKRFRISHVHILLRIPSCCRNDAQHATPRPDGFLLGPTRQA